MKKSFRFCVLSLVVLATMILASSSSSAAPRKTEEQLIAMLRSQNYKDVLDALDRLPDWYPHSTNAIPVIKEILVRRAPVISPYVAPNIVTRKAARALGDYHATLTPDESKAIYEFFMPPHDPDSIMDGLKALRGMNAPEAVPQILAMLKDPNEHVLRDSCRTLAVLGNKDTIPYIEPLLSNPSSAVRKDAKDAIAALKAKP